MEVELVLRLVELELGSGSVVSELALGLESVLGLDLELRDLESKDLSLAPRISLLREEIRECIVLVCSLFLFLDI
jgi:hypothetical protein